MPRLTSKEWKLVYSACHCLYDSLDISNSDIKDRLPELFEINKKDMEILDRIMIKISNSVS